MNDIGIFNETEEEIKELEQINNLMEYALNFENVKNALFNIIIIDNKRIKEINKEYRKIDKETDVISFALEDSKDFIYPDFRLLGDIYISLDKVKEQSNLYGHSFLRELAFLSVHGLLHLLGYDHLKKEEEIIMFEKQSLILDGYGIKK
ncbi:MAG: rRNA maturation RNase YbeY [Bacilli bacterium]